MRRDIFKSRQTVVLLVLSSGIWILLGILIIQDWENLISFPWRLEWGYIGIGALMHLLALSTLFLGWYQMMRRLGMSEDWRRDFVVYSLSALARRIPAPVWYIGSRLYLYREYKVPSELILSATGLEAALIATSGLICYLLFLPWYKIYAQRWFLELGGVGLSMLLGVLLFRPNLLIDISNWVLRLLGRPQLSVSVTRIDLVIWETIYLSTWLLDGISLYLVVGAFFPQLPSMPDILGVSTISALVALATLVLPAGFGLKELTMSALLSIWMPLSAGVAIAIFYRLMHTFLEMLWALVGYWIGRTSRGNASIVQKNY